MGRNYLSHPNPRTCFANLSLWENMFSDLNTQRVVFLDVNLTDVFFMSHSKMYLPLPCDLRTCLMTLTRVFDRQKMNDSKIQLYNNGNLCFTCSIMKTEICVYWVFGFALKHYWWICVPVLLSFCNWCGKVCLNSFCIIVVVIQHEMTCFPRYDDSLLSIFLRINGDTSLRELYRLSYKSSYHNYT